MLPVSAAAKAAPLVGLDHLAGHGTIRLESLPGDNEAEFVERGRRQSGRGFGERISAPADGSVVHVEVFGLSV